MTTTPSSRQPLSRRQFLETSATVGAGITASLPGLLQAASSPAQPTAVTPHPQPALLGGPKLRQTPFPAWPVVDNTDDSALLDVLHSGKWFRGYGDTVTRFERAYAELTGARHCVATANGTSALFASLGALHVGPGDEVILPPYTFVATLNVILLHHALPVFVDSDPATFQIDASKVEAAVTDRTVALLPVHLGGSVADLDRLLESAKRRRLAVVEDACQSHLAEWRSRKVGTWGSTGCFSFQASKNLNCGEGGAILTSDDELAEKCYAFHNNGRGRANAGFNLAHVTGRSANLRLTEFQAGLLLSQMARLENQSRTRESNAQYLTSQLKEIPGIHPAQMHEGCTRNAYHLYMFKYEKEQFAGLPRRRFLQALQAEGIPCSGGYSPLNKEPFLLEALKTRPFQRIYPPEILRDWVDRNQCPANDQLCEQAVWLVQTMLLGPRQDMDDIAAAVRKIQAHAHALAQS